MTTNERTAVEHYLYARYPADRYQFKNLYTVDDMYGNSDNRLYVIEFVDLKVKRARSLELQVRERELFNFKIELS